MNAQPPAQAPERALRREQGEEGAEEREDGGAGPPRGAWRRHGVDQELERVLGGHRADGRARDRPDDGGAEEGAAPDVAQQEGGRVSGQR